MTLLPASPRVCLLFDQKQRERYLWAQLPVLFDEVTEVSDASSDLQLQAAERRKKGIIFFSFLSFYCFFFFLNVAVTKATEVIRKVNMLMITNQLSFILAVAAVPLEETTSDAQSRASASLWIALNKVGTLTLVELKLHAVRSAATLLDVLKWIFMLFLFPVDFCTFVQTCFGFICSVVQLWSVLKWLSPPPPPVSHISAASAAFSHSPPLKGEKPFFLLQQQLHKLWIQQTPIMFTGRLCLCFNDLFLSATAAGRESASWSRPGLQRRRFKLLLTDSVHLHAFKWPDYSRLPPVSYFVERLIHKKPDFLRFISPGDISCPFNKVFKVFFKQMHAEDKALRHLKKLFSHLNFIKVAEF